LFGLQDLRVYEPVADRHVLQFFERLDPLYMHDAKARFYLFVRQPDLDMLSIAGVRRSISELGFDGTWTPSQLEASGLIQHYLHDTTAVWENTSARPRAYLAASAQVALTEAEALDATARLRANGPRTVVIQDANGDGGLPVGGDAGGQVRARFWPGSAQIEVEASQAGWLVVNDALYPGWNASVDGRTTPIYRANFLFMGVQVPPGRHIVHFEYRPLSFVLGAAISAAALVVVGAALAWAAVRRRTVH
jgi:hypothetical protein